MPSLERQLRLLKRNPLPFIQFIDKMKEIYYWDCLITGPEDSPYEDGVFKINFRFPSGFPRVPPVVNFETPIYHPNVSQAGFVAPSLILPHIWDSSTAVADVIEAIWKLLAEPEIDGPSAVEDEVRDVYVNDYEVFTWIAKTTTEIQSHEFDDYD